MRAPIWSPSYPMKPSLLRWVPIMTSAANQVRVSRALRPVFGGGCGAEPRAERASHVPHADDTRDAAHDMQVL